MAFGHARCESGSTQDGCRIAILGYLGLNWGEAASGKLRVVLGELELLPAARSGWCTAAGRGCDGGLFIKRLWRTIEIFGILNEMLQSAKQKEVR